MKSFSALTLALLLLLTACSQPSGGTVRYDLDQPPSTLDPQFAESDADRTAVANLFEGLMTLSASGEVLPACAERYEESPDGCAYTFYLRERMMWSDGTPLLANDFVFAFHRLFDAATPAPAAKQFMSLKNAEAVLHGKMPVDELGVTAPNEQTICFVLSQRDPALPTRLTQSATMPCQSEFFHLQKGRYGLSAKNVLGNGPFELSSWQKDMLCLRRNERYRTPTAVDEVVMTLMPSRDLLERFLAGSSDACVVPAERLSEAQGLGGTRVYSQSWVLLFNLAHPAGASWELRAALVSALNRQELFSRLPEALLPSDALIPPDALLGVTSYRQLVGPPRMTIPQGDPRQLLGDALKKIGLTNLPSTTLLVGNFSPGYELGGLMQRCWQDQQSCYINLEQLPYPELMARIRSGHYDMALVPLMAQGVEPADYLTQFADVRLSALRPAVHHEEDGAYERTIGDLLAESRRSYDKAASDCFEAEQRLIDGYVALPLYDAPSLFVQREGVEGIVYAAATRTVYFSDARQKKP
ncbi:MAG: peptide ABC transporter substrate-binding protein [Oscillospiraceae bacterium]